MAALKDVVLSCLSKSKILKWHVKEDELVKKDKILATYIFTEKVENTTNFISQRKLKAKFNGKVVDVSVKPNEEIVKGQVVARIEEMQCEHNTIMKEMCCDCGADLRKEPGIPGELSEATIAVVPVVHNISELKVSQKEAERLAKYDELQLLRARKLVLVVDLDMTLIHTTVEPVPKDSKDVYSFTLPGHQYEYHTKLRPGAKKFLQSISKFYELHIFTMGSRMYAHTVARCLDPDGKFFAHRIRSRDEFINSYSKFHDLKALFPCGDHMVCIIDDREDVWQSAPNLIHVKPYKYFKGSDDINDPFKPETIEPTNGLKPNQAVVDIVVESERNNASNIKLIESNESALTAKIKNDGANHEETENKISNDLSNEEERSILDSKNPSVPLKDAKNFVTKAVEAAASTERIDLDDYLFYLDEILEKIHFSFYSTLDAVKSNGGSGLNDPNITKFCTFKSLNPDVRIIVPELRRQTLKGCSLVFTGVVPTNVPLEKSKAFKTAINLGARVEKDIVSNYQATTHVVAARHGTHKAHRAFRNPDIHLVNPKWLWCANERWELPVESLFPVPLMDGKSSPASSRQGTPQQRDAFESKTKKISPLAHGFEIPGGYNPEHILDSVGPLTTFSKQELEAMDKEVEELMLSANDNSSDEDSFSKTTGLDSETNMYVSSKRKATSDANMDHAAKKLKRKLLKSTKKLLSQSPSDKQSDDSRSSDSSNQSENSESGSSSTSSSSSTNSDDSDGEENELGSLLENRISESGH